MKTYKKYIYLNLIFGIIWLAVGIYQIGVQGRDHLLGYIWFMLSAFYIGIFIYQIWKLKKETHRK